MGLDTRRPPLPAPTDMSSMDDSSALGTEVATNVTARTDKTSHTIPEDGSPITISTHRVTGSGREGRHHSRQKSQTSLLIEYFEAGKSGDKVRSKPSVRVRVTPSSKKGRGSHDAVQITGIGKDRKPSYTRRISLSGKGTDSGHLEGTEISHSSESNISNRPPVEVEILNPNGSDVSNTRLSQNLQYSQLDSNVSSMPPDSLLEGSNLDSELSQQSRRDEEEEEEEEDTITQKDHLKAPTRSRSRSVSRERLTQKVMQKLGQNPGRPRKSSRSSYDYDEESHHRRRRSSNSNQLEADSMAGAESSLLSSNPTASARSYRSGTSQGSRMTNNPRLLEMVEDTIKRMILPEINQIKEDQKTDRNYRTFEDGRHGSISQSEHEQSGVHRSVSKSSSTPHLSSRPKVVLNRDGDDPGTVLSRGDSEYRKTRKSSKSGKDRPSSRRSSGRHSVDGNSYVEEETSTTHSKSGKSGHGMRNAAAGALAGGILTHAALKHHDSQDDVPGHDVHERRKKRSKSRSSRSRSASLAEKSERSYLKEEQLIPPMPMASHINDSEMTRESILSADTERPQDSSVSEDVRTPVREVSRGSIDAAMSPDSSRTPTRMSTGHGIGMSHSNTSITSGARSPISTKARLAALAAAGLGGAAAAKGVDEYRSRNVDDDGYAHSNSQRSMGSPAQSVSSLRNRYEEPLIPSALRPHSAASRSSVSKLRENQQSPASMRSATSSPNGKLAYSRKQSQNISGDEFVTPLERPNPDYMRDGLSTPNGGESVDDWYERQHQQNERYRDSYEVDTNRQSYQTNPYPEDEKRFSAFTQDSQADSIDDQTSLAQDVHGIGANPGFIHHAGGVESNVASLVDPSTLSSALQNSSVNSSAKTNGTYSDRMSEHLRAMGKDGSGIYEGSTLSQSMPSPNRWAAIKGQAAENLTASPSRDDVHVLDSPRQSETKSLRQEKSLDEPIQLGASGLPVADDPLPEIGHYDDTKSEISTNPSIIQGPLGGDATGKNTWPYTPSPPRSAQSYRDDASGRTSRSSKHDHGKEVGAGLLGAAAGGAAALAASKAAHGRKASVEDEYLDSPRQTPDNRRYADDRYQRDAQLSPDNGNYGNDGYGQQGQLTPGSRRYSDDGYERGGKLTPDGRYQGEAMDRNATPTSPAMLRDEGYDTAHDRSAGAPTPKAERKYGKDDLDAFNKAMNGLGSKADPFISDPRHARHLSGNSHGMASPLYDSSTGKGMDNIASKDIVALMDHLTVRDAQRNARDTEILVTLVRSATEMRDNFEDIKQFIKEQDRMIMNNTDRDADITVQRVLGGPRPQPPSSPRTPRRESQEDIQTKRKGVLRRALKGLTGGKSTNDLAKVEEMLMQILDNVEDLKHQGIAPRQPISSYMSESMDSYEKLRSAPDPGYEPEGTAGSNSTPSHSGGLSIPRGEKQQFHSGYNGRPGSENRVSTVIEDDEDQESFLGPHEQQVLNNQFESNERMLTPTQENHSGLRGLSPTYTPPRRISGGQENELTPRSTEKQQKHKSNSSSIFAAVPKISRWSKTTSSSAVPGSAAVDSPGRAQNERPTSRTSRASSSLRTYDSDDYSVRDDKSVRSQQSFAQEPEQSQHAAETRSMRSQASRLTRTPSPLIPSEASCKYSDDYDASPIQYDEQAQYAFDDPKYQAHRNSLPLQHPQPRQGPTSRHQNTLETQAHAFGDESALGTSSDLSQRTTSDFDPAMWGSAGAAALNRGRFSAAQTSSPVSLGSPISGKTKEETPLTSASKPASLQQHSSKTKYEYDDDDDDWEPQYSNSGFAKNKDPSRMYYSSPLGSGHLLEPIEEVRYSLETDSGHSPEPQVSSARAVDVRSQQRKITGPRPMGARSPAPQGARLVDSSGTVRRKPVPGSHGTTT